MQATKWALSYAHWSTLKNYHFNRINRAIFHNRPFDLCGIHFNHIFNQMANTLNENMNRKYDVVCSQFLPPVHINSIQIDPNDGHSLRITELHILNRINVIVIIPQWTCLRFVACSIFDINENEAFNLNILQCTHCTEPSNLQYYGETASVHKKFTI